MMQNAWNHFQINSLISCYMKFMQTIFYVCLCLYMVCLSLSYSFKAHLFENIVNFILWKKNLLMKTTTPTTKWIKKTKTNYKISEKKMKIHSFNLIYINIPFVWLKSYNLYVPNKHMKIHILLKYSYYYMYIAHSFLLYYTTLRLLHCKWVNYSNKTNTEKILIFHFVCAFRFKIENLSIKSILHYMVLVVLLYYCIVVYWTECGLL